MTLSEIKKFYDEAKEAFDEALKVQLKQEAAYLSANGYVNEDESLPGSIAEIKNRKLREIAHNDFWKNHQTMDTAKFKAAKHCLEYAERKLETASEAVA